MWPYARGLAFGLLFLGACSSSKQSPPLVDASTSEGILFRDSGPMEQSTPKKDGAPGADGAIADALPRDGKPPLVDALLKPDKGPTPHCLVDWQGWACTGSPLTGCVARCAKLTLACNALGSCTCSLGTGPKQTCAPIPPVPPPLPGCGLCQRAYEGSCCGPTP